MKLKVTFVLPGPGNTPCGGYKIVYEYANFLAENDYDVSIGFDCRNIGKVRKLPEIIRKIFRYPIAKYRVNKYPTWFSLSKDIHKFCIFDENIPYTDYCIATAYGTSALVAMQKESKRVYLIQDLENWGNVSYKQVINSYKMFNNRIVVSNWLLQILKNEALKGNNKLIVNGINLTKYKLLTPIDSRKLHTAAMLYHQAPYKGSCYGIDLLCRLKRKYDDFEAVLFGVPERPNDLPSWIKYIQNASVEQLVKIYNESLIYILPSIEEGFGLTGVESMACGCVLCTSDFRGSKEYAVHLQNAMVSPVKNVELMMKNVENLYEDEELRLKIAKNAIESAKNFDKNKAQNEFLKFIKQI